MTRVDPNHDALVGVIYEFIDAPERTIQVLGVCDYQYSQGTLYDIVFIEGKKQYTMKAHEDDIYLWETQGVIRRRYD